MPRKLLRRILPGAHRVRAERSLRPFGERLHNGNLWHLNRRSVARAVAVGLFCAFVPIPGQTVLAAAVAIVAGCNLPIAVVLVWISNPVTIGPLFFAAYKVGAWLLDETPRRIHFEATLEWLLTRLVDVWEPFLLGCLVMGTASAILGQLTVRVIWRIHVIQSWRERRARRRAGAARPAPARRAREDVARRQPRA